MWRWKVAPETNAKCFKLKNIYQDINPSIFVSKNRLCSKTCGVDKEAGKNEKNKGKHFAEEQERDF